MVGTVQPDIEGLAAFLGAAREHSCMHVLRDPVITLEDIRLRKISFSTLDLELNVRVENPNLLGITLHELPFTVICSSGQTEQQLASGTTGRVTIAARGSTVLRVPVRSQNAALIGTLATLVTKGGVQVTIRGVATVDAVLFYWPVPFEKTLPVTIEQVTGALAGKEIPD